MYIVVGIEAKKIQTGAAGEVRCRLHVSTLVGCGLPQPEPAADPQERRALLLSLKFHLVDENVVVGVVERHHNQTLCPAISSSYIVYVLRH